MKIRVSFSLNKYITIYANLFIKKNDVLNYLLSDISCKVLEPFYQAYVAFSLMDVVLPLCVSIYTFQKHQFRKGKADVTRPGFVIFLSLSLEKYNDLANLLLY